jgi:hypothetical protein
MVMDDIIRITGKDYEIIATIANANCAKTSQAKDVAFLRFSLPKTLNAA